MLMAVQKPLTLVMKLATEDPAAIKKIREDLKKADVAFQSVFARTNIVHFARFVLLDGKEGKELGLFTVYDGDLDIYLGDFIELGHHLIDLILKVVKDPPLSPVIDHRLEFIEWVKSHDLKWFKDDDSGAETLTGAVTFFSAYPGHDRQVIDIK